MSLVCEKVDKVLQKSLEKLFWNSRVFDAPLTAGKFLYMSTYSITVHVKSVLCFLKSIIGNQRWRQLLEGLRLLYCSIMKHNRPATIC